MVVKVVRGAEDSMEVMVVGGTVEVAMGIVVVVEEELSVTSMKKIVISQGNVVKVLDMEAVLVVRDFQDPK